VQGDIHRIVLGENAVDARLKIRPLSSAAVAAYIKGSLTRGTVSHTFLPVSSLGFVSSINALMSLNISPASFFPVSLQSS
jgi:hypothetical protein